MTLQPENGAATGLSGLYVHVPFCVRKCPYCGFYSTTDVAKIDAYLGALETEMRCVLVPAVKFDTIYLGGGTPSLLKPSDVHGILEHASAAFDFVQDVEITIEVNPGTLSRGFLESFLSFGGSRVNIGVQSFDDGRLAFLGRIHSARQARAAIRSARRAGIRNLGLDLIYGLPGQNRTAWLEDLKEAVCYEPEHISCYMLTYEEGTPLCRWRKERLFDPLGDGRVRDLFEETICFLGAKGYEQYEISNFSRGRPFRSRHNQKYWSHAPYIGLGPSAHSFVEPKRWWNGQDLAVYLERLQGGRPPVEGFEVLTREQLILETVYLGFRTSQGVDLPGFKGRYGSDFMTVFSGAVERVATQNLSSLLNMSSDRCALTTKGKAFADTITAFFAECLPD